MTDADLMALCIFTEARGEPYEGKCAVGRVILNRIAERWFSDGTMAGTVLAKDQFSAFWFDMVDGKYTRICETQGAAAVHAENLLANAKTDAMWPHCQKACADAAPGSGYAPGPVWAILAAAPRALLYANLAISSPVWATPEKKVCSIFHHTFFKP